MSWLLPEILTRWPRSSERRGHGGLAEGGPDLQHPPDTVRDVCLERGRDGVLCDAGHRDALLGQPFFKLGHIYKTPESEQQLWALDQHMNDNGVKLDIPMVEKIVEYDTQRRQELQEEASARLPGRPRVRALIIVQRHSSGGIAAPVHLARHVRSKFALKAVLMMSGSVMHRVMGVDIETYSSVDLAGSGVYAYTEAPDFDILLIGYKFDDEAEVHVIDSLGRSTGSAQPLVVLELLDVVQADADALVAVGVERVEVDRGPAPAAASRRASLPSGAARSPAT